jgi:UDP-N-acetylmuramoylalanine--D-glutamate ligase
MDLEGKRVVVVGLARSGVAAARELALRGAHVVAVDRKREEGLSAEALSLRGEGVELRLGGHDAEALREAALVVVSPGVPWTLPELREAQRLTEVIGEVEFASRLLRGTLAAVTGTKGKSTTTAALGAMLGREHADVRVGGNIGKALTELVHGSTDDTFFVVETSSFQLQATTSFHPKLSVFLNLSTDHLDQHKDFAEYASAKARIFANQAADDLAVVNADDPAVMRSAHGGQARIVTFTTSGGEPRAGADGAYFAGTSARLRLAGHDEELFDRRAVRLRGAHLAGDLLAAATAARLLGTTPRAIAAAVADFRGAEHVLEDVGSIGGVSFINDSKATNVEAAKRGLEAIDGPLVVILGGRHKGGDFAELGPALASRERFVVAIGEARPRIVADLGARTRVLEADSMDDAVRRGFEAMRGTSGAVLLAPACSSFDMFRDYAERGRAFKQAVARLAHDEAEAEGGGDHG